MIKRPYWTVADQAELDVLARAFIDGFYDHRPSCAVCAAGGSWCANAVEAFDALCAWRRFRALRSRAAWLREEQLVREALVDSLTEAEGSNE